MRGRNIRIANKNKIQLAFSLFRLFRLEQERKAAELAEAEERDKFVRTRDYRIYTLNEMYKTTVARSKQIVDWFTNGGVMLMGYEMYRLLVSQKVSNDNNNNMELS